MYKRQLRNRLRSVSLAVPKIDHGKIRSHKISQNIVDCEVPRFCEIFCEILISQNIKCFGKYCEKISWKYLFEKILFYPKIFLSFWKVLLHRPLSWKGFWKAFYTVANKFYFHLKSNCVQIVFPQGFYFLKIQSFLFLFKKDFPRLQAMFNWEKECVTARFYFLKPQAFLFLIKIVFHGYLRQIAKQFWSIGFQLRKNSELSRKKKIESLWVCD